MTDKTEITFEFNEGAEDDTYTVKVVSEYTFKLEKETFEDDKDKLEFEKYAREEFENVIGDVIDGLADELEALE